MITLTLEEILHNCNNWTNFCDYFGYSEWCVNEGGGSVKVTMTIAEAKQFGII